MYVACSCVAGYTFAYFVYVLWTKSMEFGLQWVCVIGI